LNLRIPGREDKDPDTFSVPLSAVASYELAGGSGSLRHADQLLVVTIEGNIAEGYNENAVREGVIALLAQMKADGLVPPGSDLRLGGANDEQRDATAFLGRAFLIAIFLITIVLVTQFNSFTLPAIILASVVLSLVGVLWGLIITGTPFGVIMTGIGVISLAGVVVNNAIVLLDYVEQLRARGLGMHESLIKAGLTRFRPVVLTAITTVLGLLPMALGVSFDFTNFKLLVGGQNAEFWGPMAIAVIFGLLFATVLTLVMVPTLYSIIEDIKMRTNRLLGRTVATTVTVTATGLMLLVMLPGVSHAAPLTLEDALIAAEDNNISLALAREQTIQTQTLRGQALSRLTPTLTGQLGFNYSELEDVTLDFAEFVPEEFAAAFEGGGDPIVVQQQQYWSGNLTVSQPIFNAQAFPAWYAAKRTIAGAEQSEAWTRVQLRGAVASSFYQLALTRESLPLAEKAVSLAEQQQRLSELQVASGDATQRDLLEVSLALSQAQRDLRSAQRRELTAAREFAIATGLSTTTPLQLPAPVEVPDDLDQALSKLEGRPDVLAADEQVEAARLTRLAQDLGWLPNVSASFTYNYNQNSGFVGEEIFWVAGVQGNWTLWDGGNRIALQRRDASQQRSAQLSAQLTRMEAEQELIGAWESLQQSQLAMEVAQEQVGLAEQNLRLAEASESAGSINALQADNARLLHLQASIGLLQERVSRDLSAVQLHMAMGDF
jgi:outer membrane protein TolC